MPAFFESPCLEREQVDTAAGRIEDLYSLDALNNRIWCPKSQVRCIDSQCVITVTAIQEHAFESAFFKEEEAAACTVDDLERETVGRKVGVDVIGHLIEDEEDVAAAGDVDVLQTGQSGIADAVNLTSEEVDRCRVGSGRCRTNR